MLKNNDSITLIPQQALSHIKHSKPKLILPQISQDLPRVTIWNSPSPQCYIKRFKAIDLSVLKRMKDYQRFLPYMDMTIILVEAKTIWTIVCSYDSWRLYMKYGFNWLSGFRKGLSKTLTCFRISVTLNYSHRTTVTFSIVMSSSVYLVTIHTTLLYLKGRSHEQICFVTETIERNFAKQFAFRRSKLFVTEKL